MSDSFVSASVSAKLICTQFKGYGAVEAGFADTKISFKTFIPELKRYELGIRTNHFVPNVSTQSAVVFHQIEQIPDSRATTGGRRIFLLPLHTASQLHALMANE